MNYTLSKSLNIALVVALASTSVFAKEKKITPKETPDKETQGLLDWFSSWDPF